MYRWVEHTAELELELETATERELLADALSALRELLESEETRTRDRSEDRSHPLEPHAIHGAEGASHPLERRAVQVTARDRPALLAAWLEELLFLSESAGFIPVEIDQLVLGADGLRAMVAGRVGEPRPLVKAVTYHRLQFEPIVGGYRGRVVFDV